MTRAEILMATAYVLSMDFPILPHDIPVIYIEQEEEEEDELDS